MARFIHDRSASFGQAPGTPVLIGKQRMEKPIIQLMDISSDELLEKELKGFIDTGLWGVVRHPNYAAEQAIWIVFYFFSVAATGRWINWSVMGAILLVLLFLGSSNFSESISSGKYPEYVEYKRHIPRFIPFIS